MSNMKTIAVLGSTGSIGRNTLNLVEMFPERYAVKALTGARNITLLAEQIRQFRPEIAAVFDSQGAKQLAALLSNTIPVNIVYGESGYREAATHPEVDTVVAAMVGAAGLSPTLAAIEAGKNIALANKETLVMAGEIVMSRAAEKKVSLLPVDSEHSAIFQCLEGNRKQDLRKILLTASGGPFLHRHKRDFAGIRIGDALNHPNWSMGRKITIDSATLMNKGLEVIEAKWLFDVPVSSIEVVVHPQSIVHSMVVYRDGSVMAQMGIPDMRGAISYALSYPERLFIGQPEPDFFNIAPLTFLKPDLDKFPCLKLAFDACDAGKTFPAVMNAANEVAVTAFLAAALPFVGIPAIIEKTLAAHSAVAGPALADIVDADHWARRKAAELIGA